MRIQEAVDACRTVLHMAPSEAAVYVHLCLGGPAKAGDLATALKLHRNEVYRTTTRLLGRGLLEMTMERPARYAAVAPEKVFEAEIASHLAEVDQLKDAKLHVAPFLHTLELPQATDKRNTYKVVQGRQEIYAVRNRLIEEARTSISWATTFPPAIGLADATGAFDLLKRRMDEGVKVRGAVMTTPQGWDRLGRLVKHPRAAFRAIDVGSVVRFWIFDDHELLMFVVNDPSESVRAKDEVAIQTTAPGFVQAETVFFDQTWRAGRDVA